MHGKLYSKTSWIANHVASELILERTCQSSVWAGNARSTTKRLLLIADWRNFQTMVG
ncbi:unnamed protein product [Mycetohabitans rhizoxinica HKI 454]|uniref:Uncharacterized protein n=1 Tax=Mycetohabitans rhizoxinica (strain DSM 19002 / CIP 109453 / HKI 454) TaxID=882378 RepID=E5ARV6_MYCRK|nr:unnamed protein product [Mycetohabitans rhizoxinica HKI 454]